MEDVLSWLETEYFNHSATFNYEELKPILGFSLLWNLFESCLCNRCADYTCLTRISETVSDRLSEDLLTNSLDYFKQRYVNEKDLNETFATVRIPEYKMNLIRSVLIENEDNKCRRIETVLIIAYRFRNNLFHGEKELRELNSQRNNFMILNKFIATIILINRGT